MSQPLYQWNNLYMVFPGIACDLLHFLHCKSTGGTYLGVTWVFKFVLPFPYQHIDLIFGQIADETFHIFPLILVVLGVIVGSPFNNIGPVNNLHSGNKSSPGPLLNNLKQGLGAIEQSGCTFGPDGQLAG